MYVTNCIRKIISFSQCTLGWVGEAKIQISFSKEFTDEIVTEKIDAEYSFVFKSYQKTTHPTPSLHENTNLVYCAEQKITT
jgi:hypothetical protein